MPANISNFTSKKAIEFLSEITINVEPKDKEILEKIANTSMQTKLVSIEATDLAKLAVDAVLKVIEEKNGTFKVNLDNIKIEKKTGGSISDSELVSGIILDKEIVHSGMSRRIENAKIALINEALEIKKTEFDAKLDISSEDNKHTDI